MRLLDLADANDVELVQLLFDPLVCGRQPGRV
jgi:hypothetical protein